MWIAYHCWQKLNNIFQKKKSKYTQISINKRYIHLFVSFMCKHFKFTQKSFPNPFSKFLQDLIGFSEKQIQSTFLSLYQPGYWINAI